MAGRACWKHTPPQPSPHFSSSVSEEAKAGLWQLGVHFLLFWEQLFFFFLKEVHVLKFALPGGGGAGL